MGALDHVYLLCGHGWVGKVSNRRGAVLEYASGGAVVRMAKLYLSVPFGKTFHIFNEKDMALCGKAMMLRKCERLCTPLVGDEVYQKGQDCKACFRKAGLKVKG